MARRNLFVTVALVIVALLIRLPYLGHFLTIDEVKWIEGAGQFLLALSNGQLAETYWHFFPGITITWGEAIILVGRYWISGSIDLPTFVTAEMTNLANLVGAIRLSGVIITAFIVGGIYVLGQPLFGYRATLLGAGLLAVDPFFTAHSRIVNGDAIVAGLIILAFLAFARLWQKPYWLFAVLAGVMVGLALLTKLPAPLSAMWLTGLALARAIKTGHWRFWLTALAVSGVTAAITFVLFWPAMWVAPVETIQRLYAESFEVGEVGSGHDTFFMGEISQNPGWLFYPVAIAYRLTPVTVIGLIAVGVWWALIGKQKSDQGSLRKRVTALMLYILFIYIMANFSPKKLDRYMMVVIPPLLLLAGIGVNRILLKWGTAYQALLIGGIISLQAWFTISHYPYLLTYYNPLLGGFAQAYRQVPIGWGEGLEQAAAWVNQQPNAESLHVSSWYGDIVQPYLVGEMTSFSSSGKGQLTADYVFFYANQVQRQKPNQALVAYFSDKEPVFQVAQNGQPFVWVYEAPQMQTAVSGSNKIEGRATLLGYSWQPQALTHAGQTAKLTLYLNTLGPLPNNETFHVAMADGAGNLHGSWVAETPLTWTNDTIIEWRGTLTLPTNLRPSNYQLVVRLMDTNTDQEVTRFPLEEGVITLVE